MSPSDESAPVFSRDGRFLAYVSDESGRSEVYVQPYPGPGEKWPVSTDGGTDPVWAPDGGQLYYRAGSQIMAVTIKTARAFVAGKPQRLFDDAFEFSELHRNFDLSPDGTKFLAIRSQGAEPAAEFRVIFNWLLELREKGQPR
jgi:Tol biopolymer transport system component